MSAGRFLLDRSDFKLCEDVLVWVSDKEVIMNYLKHNGAVEGIHQS